MATVQTVLILKADRLSADALRAAAQRILPAASIEIAASADTARAALAARSTDFFITGLDPSSEGDVLGVLATLDGHSSTRVMVIVGQEEGRLLAALPAMAVHAAFDATTDAPETFPSALRAFVLGGRYWSASIWPRIWSYQTMSSSVGKSLTAMEQFVLSIIGDGCDDESAARLLALKQATIATIRRNLHRKLGVQHRGDLMRFAAQNGFVRFTTRGIVRPGIALLAAACRSTAASRSPFAERDCA